MNKRLVIAILEAGLVAGTMDWIGAVTVFMLRGGSGPEQIFIFIASALIGDKANAMEQWIPYFGFAMHYAIAYSWTILFFIAYPRIAAMRANPLLVGPAYGVIVWLVMNLVVLPLTLLPPRPIVLQSAVIGAFVLMVCIGTPLAFFARRYYRSA